MKWNIAVRRNVHKTRDARVGFYTGAKKSFALRNFS